MLPGNLVCLFACFCCLILGATSVHSTGNSLFSQKFINERGQNSLGIGKVHLFWRVWGQLIVQGHREERVAGLEIEPKIQDSVEVNEDRENRGYRLGLHG